MKLETIVMMVVMVGLVFAIAGLVVNDLKNQYPEVTADTSWQDKYDYSSDINKSASRIINFFDKIGEKETGWAIITGIVALPVALIEGVKIITLSLTSGIKIVVGVGSDVGIDPAILSFIVILLIISVVFMLINFWRKTEVPA